MIACPGQVKGGGRVYRTTRAMNEAFLEKREGEKFRGMMVMKTEKRAFRKIAIGLGVLILGALAMWRKM